VDAQLRTDRQKNGRPVAVLHGSAMENGNGADGAEPLLMVVNCFRRIPER